MQPSTHVGLERNSDVSNEYIRVYVHSIQKQKILVRVQMPLLSTRLCSIDLKVRWCRQHWRKRWSVPKKAVKCTSTKGTACVAFLGDI